MKRVIFTVALMGAAVAGGAHAQLMSQQFYCVGNDYSSHKLYTAGVFSYTQDSSEAASGRVLQNLRNKFTAHVEARYGGSVDTTCYSGDQERMDRLVSRLRDSRTDLVETGWNP